MSSHTITKQDSFIVIGGGVSGLYTAWKLCKKGYSVTLLERDKFLGGLSTSILYKGCAIDIGPHIVSLEQNSEITHNIYELMGAENIIELSSVNQSFKSYFKGKILDSPPKLKNVFSDESSSIIRTLVDFPLSKLKLSKRKNKSDVENYLVSLYGKFLFDIWCKPLLITNFGDLTTLEFVKNSFEPITFQKIIRFIQKKSYPKQQIPNKVETESLACYFRFGMGSFINNLQKKIESMGGKIILGVDITSIKHEKIKSVTFKKNNQIHTETSSNIIYSIPHKIALQWFENPPTINNELNINNTFHGIMVFLLIDAHKLFDGWLLYIYDLTVPFFRISQQTYLSSDISPPNKTLLCIEIRTNEKESIWSYDETTLFNKIKHDLTKLKILNGEKIEEYKIRKFKNLYPSRDSDTRFDETAKNYINTHEGEFALGAVGLDAGRLVSNDGLTKKKQKKIYGGFYSSLLNSEELLTKIPLNDN